MTQIEKIINYMEQRGSITSLEAMQELGCMRLASRMCDIKALGYNVVREMETSKNRSEEQVHYARYRIITEAAGNEN